MSKSNNNAPEMFLFPTKPEDAKKFQKAYDEFLAVAKQFEDDPNFEFLPFVMANSDQYMKCIKKYMSEDDFNLHKLHSDRQVLKDIVQETLAKCKLDKNQLKEYMTHYRLKDKLLSNQIEALEKKIRERDEAKPEVNEEIKAEIEDVKEEKNVV